MDQVLLRTLYRDTRNMHQKRDDIQGLRGIAVLAVLVFHVEHFLLPGGFIGVDIFFVLSGYLITGVLLRPMEEGRFSIGDFYRRRVRRLFPALFTVMAFAYVAGFIVFPPVLLSAQMESQFFTTLFLSNFYFEDNADYFDLEATLLPLLHTWSLGVEEQFYLLFPPILYALHRWARRYLMPVLLALALISLYFSQKWISEDIDIAFYFPASRAFELLIGALCVGLERQLRLKDTMKQALGVFALGGMIAGFFVITARSPFPGLLALLPCLSTAVLLLTKDAWANRVLSAKPLSSIGDISYSLYLWHWPLLIFAGFMYPDSKMATGIAALLSFAAAIASYRFIEQPFLRKEPRRLFAGAALFMAISIGSAFYVYLNDGLPRRFSPESRKFLEASDDYNKDRPRCHMRGSKPRPYTELCIYGDAGVPTRFAVWGDSHGAELAMVLGQRLEGSGQSLKSITMSGCPATTSRRAECTQNTNHILESILNDPDMHTVFLSSNLHGRDAFGMDTAAGITETARTLKKAGKRPIIIYPLPTFDFDPPSRLALNVRAGKDPALVRAPRSQYQTMSQHFVDAFEVLYREENIEGLNTAEILCDDAYCHTYRPEIGVLYYNQGHVSLTGAGLLADALIEQFSPLDTDRQ